jgi:hypothetical protein
VSVAVVWSEQRASERLLSKGKQGKEKERKQRRKKNFFPKSVDAKTHPRHANFFWRNPQANAAFSLNPSEKVAQKLEQRKKKKKEHKAAKTKTKKKKKRKQPTTKKKKKKNERRSRKQFGISP